MNVKEVVASAPGRCGIIGNPSDIYGGAVISCSVSARNRCTMRRIEPNSTTCEDSRFNGWALPDDLRLLQAAFNRLPIDGFYEVSYETDVPRSSGLAGSTALLAAIVACLLVLRGEANRLEDPVAISELVRDIERNEAGIVCGYQDAYMVVHGGARFLDFAGKHPVEPGPVGKVKDAHLGDRFLLITTGVQRLSGSVHGPIAERWLNGDQDVQLRILRAATQAHAVYNALQNDTLTDELIAEAMTWNFVDIQAMGGSGEAIDELVKVCLEGGAKSAKLAGAGMGGTVIAFHDDLEALESFARSKGYTRFMKPLVQEGLILETVKG